MAEEYDGPLSYNAAEDDTRRREIPWLRGSRPPAQAPETRPLAVLQPYVDDFYIALAIVSGQKPGELLVAQRDRQILVLTR